MRRPGLPFGQQAQQGGGGIGLPDGPAVQRGGDDRSRPRIRWRERAPAAQGTPQAQGVSPAASKVPGLARATFKGGYTCSFWKADVATGEAQEIWHNQPGDTAFNTVGNMRLAGDYLVFRFNVGGGAGRARRAAGSHRPARVDEWDRYHSLNLTSPDSTPVLLTTTDGLIEDQTSVALSPDGKTLFYCTNARDIERRHIWAVPVAGGTPAQVTTGIGIETRPTPLASGRRSPRSAPTGRCRSRSASGRSSEQAQPPRPPRRGSCSRPSRKGFPADAHVEPQLVLTKAADGLEIHNQLFLPKDIKPGEKRPAIVFVHGGPVRQMLLGYHYMQFYHWAYAINQWLASQGYVVLSINYRQRRRLRPLVPHRAEHRRRRQRRVPGRRRRRRSTCSRAPTWIPTASASGGCRTAAC